MITDLASDPVGVRMHSLKTLVHNVLPCKRPRWVCDPVGVRIRILILLVVQLNLGTKTSTAQKLSVFVGELVLLMLGVWPRYQLVRFMHNNQFEMLHLVAIY